MERFGNLLQLRFPKVDPLAAPAALDQVEEAKENSRSKRLHN
jgi:hypothetical protein